VTGLKLRSSLGLHIDEFNLWLIKKATKEKPELFLPLLTEEW